MNGFFAALIIIITHSEGQEIEVIPMENMGFCEIAQKQLADEWSGFMDDIEATISCVETKR